MLALGAWSLLEQHGALNNGLGTDIFDEAVHN
jgi:hypothetical protein